MARIFITGSTDGLGFLAAKALYTQGHQVYLHARNQRRADEVRSKFPEAEDVLIADFTDLGEVAKLANRLNELGKMDVIIHNAGIYDASGIPLFTVNVLAPYLLTAKVAMPDRLLYLSSGMHKGGQSLNDKNDIPSINYSDSKLHLTTLSMAVARLNPQVLVNAVDPGWVPTKMGGKNAPDQMELGYETQVWLAVSDDDKARVTGKLFYHQKQQKAHPDSSNVEIQNRLLEICESITGQSLKH